MAMKNRDLTFIVKVQNRARAALKQLRGDLSGVGTGGADAAKKLEGYNRKLDELRKKSQAATVAVNNNKTSFLSLGKVAGAVFATFGARQVANMSDEYTSYNNRIKVVTASQEEAVATYHKLRQVSKDTMSSMEASVTTYQRVKQAQSSLGVSSVQIFEFISSLNNAVRISGATAVEAQAGLLQLAQGLGSGVLQGQELNAVLESLPFVAKQIAEELGVKSPAALKKLAADGLVPSIAVFRALHKNMEANQELAAKMVPTIGQAMGQLRDEASHLLGTFMSSSGIAEGFSKAILWLRDNMAAVAKAAAYAGIMIGGFFAAKGVAVAYKAVSLATVGVRAYTAALVSLSFASGGASLVMSELALATKKATLAMMKNPVTLIAVAVAAAISAIVYFGNKTYTIFGETVSGWQAVLAAFKAGVAFLKSVWNSITDGISTHMRKLVAIATLGLSEVVMVFWENWDAIVKFVSDTWNSLTSVSGQGIMNILATVFPGMAALLSGIYSVWDLIRGAFADNWNAVVAMAKNAIRIILAVVTFGLSEVWNALSNSELMKRAGKAAGKAYKDGIKEAGKENKDKADEDAWRGFKFDTTVGNVSTPSVDEGGKKKAGAKSAGKSAAEQLKDDLKSLMKEIFPAEARLDELREKMELLNKSALTGSLKDFALSRLEEAYGEGSTAIGQYNKSLDEQMRTATVAGRAAEEMAERIELENAVREDQGHLSDSMRKKLVDEAMAKFRLVRSTEMMTDAQADLNEKIREMQLDRSAIGMSERDKAVYLEVESKRLDLMEQAQIAGMQVADMDEQQRRDYEGIIALVQRYKAEVIASSDAQDRLAGDAMAGMRNGIRTWYDNARNMYQSLSDFTGQTVDGMSNAFADFFTTGKLGFASLARSAIAELNRIIMRALFMKAISGIFGGPTSMVSSVMGAHAANPGIFHGGGMAGSPGRTRAVNPMLFRNATRMHKGGMGAWARKRMGLARGEVPIIALENERILNPKETKAYNAGEAAGMARNTASRAAPAMGMAGGSPQQIVLAPVFNNDFSGIAKQQGLGEDQARSASKALEDEMGSYMERWVSREMRPGGRLASKRA